MTNFVQVNKVELREGEELQSFIGSVIKALAQHKQKTNKSLMLAGIFKGFIVTRDIEKGTFFKVEMARSEDGLFKLGKVQEVRQAFVPVTQKKEKAEEQEPTLVAVNGDVQEISLDSDTTQQVIKSLADAIEEGVEIHPVEEPNLWDGLNISPAR